TVKHPAGLDSLQTPPLRRTPIEQDAFDDSLDENDRQTGLRDMARTLRESVSVQRANAFIKSLPGSKGDRIESADIPIDGEKGFTDLIALLLHAESTDAKFRLEVERIVHEETPPHLDSLEGCSVERFSIIKK
ncbi:MAG: Wadjet anti-phage system protein JetA family protein, partial [Verrucomicrobiales bacterium]